MARFCTLASGSQGNATYITTGDGDVLIDAGINCKSLMQSIDAAGVDFSKLRAIAITHAHDDHIKGLKVLFKKVQVPLVASSETLETLTLKGIIPQGANLIAAESGLVTIGDIALDFFKTSHDEKGSGGYVVNLPDGRRAAVCTDLGVVSDEIRQKISGCDVVLLESNHDVEMLRRGPYPAHLKLRILSDEGHLSNTACSVELPALLKSGTKRIILGHISAQNNTPLLALNSARTALSQTGAEQGVDYILETAKQKTVGVTVF